jgi:hypothetical protein
MERPEELQAVADVRDRLQRKFSHVHAGEVERAVAQAHREFDERAAADRLTRIPTQRASSTA